MSCENKLIPPEVQALKDKATAFADQLEGDLLDTITAIESGIASLEAELKAALPKLPEIPDLQSELTKIMDEISASANSALAPALGSLDSDLAAATSGLEKIAGDAEAALNGKLESLKSKFGSIPGVSNAQDLLSGKLDLCAVPAIKEDGTEKPTPPKNPIEVSPAQSALKKEQKKEVTDEVRIAAAAKANRSLIHTITKFEQHIISDKFITEYKLEALSKEEQNAKIDEVRSWYRADLIKSFADSVGGDYRELSMTAAFSLPVKLKKYNELTPTYSDKAGNLFKFAEKKYNERFNIKRDKKITDKTFEEACKILYEDTYLPSIQKDKEKNSE